MVFRQYDLVVFDFDGTIANLDVDWVELKNDLSERFGTEFSPLELVLESLPENKIIEARKVVEGYELKGVESMRPMKGTINVIKKLNDNGKKIALFTGNSKASIINALGKLGISDVFEIMVCREDVKKHKPDPEGLLRILKATGVPAERAVYIGDRQKDVDAGEAAEIRTVLVAGLEKEAEG